MGEGEGCLPGTNGKATVVSLKSFNSEDCVRCDGSRQGLPMVRWTATRTHRGGPNAYWREVRFRCVSPGGRGGQPVACCIGPAATSAKILLHF